MALLKAFNPHELTAGIVLSVATGREKPLEQILSVVRDNLDAPIKQHIIVSAPRGYGKSFFLRYIEVKIAEIAETEGLPVVMALLPEELPHVKEPDTLIAEIRRTFLNRPADTVGVRWTEDDGSAWDAAIKQLDSDIENRFGAGRGLLIAGVENFDLLVKKAFAKRLQSGRLREFLTRPGSRIMLLAASARGAFDRDYNLPLFKAFEEVVLEPWTIDQTVGFLIAQRRAANKAALTKPQLAKASAVATFISGTPRLATLIGEALLEDDPPGAADLLEKIVDELTPYYKERIEVLPTRSQALLDALLRGGERCSATELAKRVGAPSQSAIAAPLDDLKKDLVLIGEKAPDSAEVLLRVADRVFAHYYRKRILSHGRESCPLEALVEILALIYSPDEKRREAEKFAARGLAREAAVMTRLWEADGGVRSSGENQQSTTTSASSFNGLMRNWDRAKREGQLVEGLSLVQQAIALARNSDNIADETSALCCAASTLYELGRTKEAEVAVNDAIIKARTAAESAELDGNVGEQTAALIDLAWALGRVGRHEEAVTIAHDAAEKAARASELGEEARALRYASISLGELGRLEQAVAAAGDAAAKAASVGDVGFQATALLAVTSVLDQLGRHEEAVIAARDAATAAISAEDSRLHAQALLDLAWSLGQLDRNEEALVAARESESKSASVGHVRGQALALRQMAWNLYVLDRYEESIVAARDAASKAVSVNDVREQSIALLNLAWSLNELGRNEEAIASARDALSAAEAGKDLKEQVDALLEIANNLQQLGRDEEAINAARDAAAITEQINDTELRLSAACGLLALRPPDGELALWTYKWLLNCVPAIETGLPQLYFDDIAYVITGQQKWPAFIALLEEFPVVAAQIAEAASGLGEPGEFLAQLAVDGRRDDVVTRCRHFVSALAQTIGDESNSHLRHLWISVLEASAEAVISQVSDVETLRSVSEVLTAHSCVPARATKLITTAVEYHANDRDPHALARLDPDLATLLTTLFPPPALRKPKRTVVKKKR